MIESSNALNPFFTLKRIFAAATIVAILGSVSIANAITLRDQGRIFGTAGRVDLGTDFFSQSITTGISGGLAAIEIQISSDFVSRTELSIFRGGNPVTTTPLIRETLDFPGRGLGNNDVFRWDLPSSQLYFTEGDVFTFGFQAEEAGQFLAANDGPFDYIGGELFKNGALSLANEDVAFITYVDPSVVPIPAALPLFGSALGFLGFVGWRKKRLGLN